MQVSPLQPFPVAPFTFAFHFVFQTYLLVDVEKDDLWTPDLDAEDANLFNAKLFPVPSKTDRTTTTARNLLLNLMRKSNIDTDMVEVWKNSQRLSLTEVSLFHKGQ